MKNRAFILLLLSSLTLASEFDVDTVDVLVKEKKIENKTSTTTVIEDDALQKSDPLLSNTKEKSKKEEPSLLDKIIAQMAEKEKTKNSSKKGTKQEKSQNHDNEVVTPDPLLDEI